MQHQPSSSTKHLAHDIKLPKLLGSGLATFKAVPLQVWIRRTPRLQLENVEHFSRGLCNHTSGDAIGSSILQRALSFVIRTNRPASTLFLRKQFISIQIYQSRIREGPNRYDVDASSIPSRNRCLV